MSQPERDDRVWTLTRMDFPMEHGPNACYISSGERSLRPGEEVKVVPASRLEQVEKERDELRELVERHRDEADERALSGNPLYPPTHRARGRADAFDEVLAALASYRAAGEQ